MIEVWKNIKGFEKQYEVSNHGRVRAKEKVTFNGRWYCTRKQKMMRPTKPNKFGYIMINLCKDGKKKHCLLHRLIAVAFIKNPKNKETINHINGIKSDNRIENLEWATRSEQNIHASKLGLKRFNGEDHSQHKLTDIQVKTIRGMAMNGGKPKGSDFGVTNATISDVLKRRSWKHI